MKTQTITWTALPNGTAQYKEGTRLRLSVYVSPRLESDDKNDTLASFPDFLDWPAALFPPDDRREVIFHVQFGSGNPIQANIVSDLPDSKLWRALFNDNTRIEPYEMKDFKNMPIQSFPVKNIQAFFKQQYVNLAATSGEDFPSADALVVNAGAPFRPLALSFRENNEEQLTATIMNELKRKGFITAGSITDPNEITKSFLQAKLFHKPFTKTRITIQPPAIDFHKALSILSDYPYLLRRLGLVYDLEIAVPLRTPTDNTVQVIATWMPRLPDVIITNDIPNWDKKMATHCYVSSTAFYALPRSGNPELVDGMLPFEDKRRYEVTTIDVDGSAIKTLSFAGNLSMARSIRKSADTPQTSSVPSLRAAGISVARIDKAEQTHLTFVKQDVLNGNLESGEDIILDAEDITRGFAIDVWDSLTRGWHSLCRRIGTYEFLKSAPAIIEKHEDEGWISQGVTSAADDSSDNLRQGESLFHWYGWSLSAPQPGKTIDPDGNPAYTGNEIDPDFELGVNFKAVPGSLPRLRYGVTYRLRARAVDLAGNRLDMNDKSLSDDKHASEPLVYGRFEPVPPPVTVMRKPVTEGESVDHVVIRSNYNTPFEAISERHIVPPKTSQTMAEEHHLFDEPGSGLVDKNAYSVIVPRESGIITGKPDSDNHDLPYVDEDELELPYLPDLFSRKAVFNGIPGVAGAYPVSFGYSEGAKWPEALPFRLVLAEDDMPKVNFHDGARVLEVLLPKAEVARVKLASGMFKDDVMQMGLIQWLMEAGKDENPSLVLAVEGRHWMLTPYRILTLVHAVRQPLLTPEFDQFFVSRSIGQTFANLQDRRMRVSIKSTVKLDIIADWTENIDPLGEAGPRVLSVSARPFDFPVDPDVKIEVEDSIYLHGRHEFGDTKYRRVTYSAIATTRFAEYFRKRLKDVKLAADNPFTLSGERLVEGSETVRLADNTASYKPYDADNKSGDYVMDYSGGAIRRTKAAEASSAIPQNTNLEVTFIEQPITRETETPRTLDVLSTARPAAPKLLYIVPTFSWQAGLSGKGDGTIESKRTGGGIRIYLERPWYTSGDGELLGVVLWPGPSSISISKDPAHEKIKPFVTQWGLDPVFLSGPIVALPTLDAFKLSKQEHKASGLVLEEVPDANLKVNIAGHEVAYDSERKLWYCDMQIDAGSTYYPFIRLALVRYQPHSLARAVTGPDTVIDPGGNNVHLSRVVLADFIQLAPDRFASVARSAAASNVRHITVSGLSYSKVGGYEGHAVIEASLEKIREGLDPEVSGELAWEPLNWNPVALAYQNVKELDGTSTWAGDITLPDTKNTYRLVIKEFEIFNIPGLIPIIQRRLVYADTIVLRP